MDSLTTLDNAFTTYNSVDPPEDNFTLKQPIQPYNPLQELHNKVIQEAMQRGFFSNEQKNRLFNKEPKTEKEVIAMGKGKDTLIQAMDKLGITGDKRTFMLKSAYIESGYNQNSTSSKSSASGFFQFIDSTRKSILPGITKEQFLNNAELQVEAASKLYDNQLDMAKRTGAYQAAVNKGLSDPEIVAGMWLNPKWAINYYKTGATGGTDANGINVPKYLQKFNSVQI